MNLAGSWFHVVAVAQVVSGPGSRYEDHRSPETVDDQQFNQKFDQFVVVV